MEMALFITYAVTIVEKFDEFMSSTFVKAKHNFGRN